MPTAKSGNGRVEVRKTYKLFINGEFVRSESGRAYRFDGNVNIPRGSRKDLRDAVRAARGAVSGWASRTAMNRGQILYRAAEMLDGRRAQFIELLGSARAAHKEVDDAVEALVWYAGWTDKGSRILWMAERMRAGVVWANTFNRFDPTSPFGGYKESGFGREGGRHGLMPYLELV